MENNSTELFISFCKEELSTGGPDPQITLLTEIGNSQKASPVDRVWLAGCYGAHHCIPSAYAVWDSFEAKEATIENLTPWLRDHWNSLPVRPEMRSHRMIEKRARCLSDFATYAIEESWKDATDYEYIWTDSISKIKYYNRYMAIKYLEFLRRMVSPQLSLNDLRAKNAWSPRRALALLWPSVEDLENEYDTRPEIIDQVESYFCKTKLILSKANVEVTSFQLQVMLCEFREALVGTYYPGASLDEELSYMKIASDDFELSPILEARSRIFDHQYLGELNGWDDVRKEKYQAFTGAHHAK